MNPLYEQMATSVFERMSGLATKHGAVNLGQGFPDFGWPDEILDAAADGGEAMAPTNMRRRAGFRRCARRSRRITDANSASSCRPTMCA